MGSRRSYIVSGPPHAVTSDSFKPSRNRGVTIQSSLVAMRTTGPGGAPPDRSREATIFVRRACGRSAVNRNTGSVPALSESNRPERRLGPHEEDVRPNCREADPSLKEV